MENEDKTAWGRWLQSHLLDKLSGTGLRPEVEYTTIPRNDKEVDCYRMVIVCPLEWRVINHLVGEDINIDKANEIADAVLAFYADAWPEKMGTDYLYDLFRRIPGHFDWLTEQAPDILYRVTMQQLTRRYGSRSVKGITMYEDLLIVHTRWAGDFSIDIDNYRVRLEQITRAMRAFMRKPIRFQYLYQLRHGKNPKK